MSEPDRGPDSAREAFRLRVAEAHAERVDAGYRSDGPDAASRGRSPDAVPGPDAGPGAHAEFGDDEDDPAADPGPVLDALDRTRADLARRATQVEQRVAAEPEVPPDVLARLDRALAAERGPDRSTAMPPPIPPAAAPPARRAPARRRALLLGALVAAAVVAVASVLVVPGAVLPGAPDAPVTGPDAPAGDVRPTLAGDDPFTVLQAGLGRQDYGPLADPARRAECLAAHGLDAGTVPIGGREVVLDGRPAVVLVLTTGIAARFRVLVVGTGCRAGAPLTLTDTVVGR